MSFPIQSVLMWKYICARLISSRSSSFFFHPSLLSGFDFFAVSLANKNYLIIQVASRLSATKQIFLRWQMTEKFAPTKYEVFIDVV